MIGKIVAGSGAGGVTSYVTQKDGAELLHSTWSGPAETWASQIADHTEAMGSAVAHTVVHVSLAAAPGEHLSDDQWRAVAEEYLARMGWGGHDHAVVRHTDTDHDHVHIIVARVGHDGQTADLHDDYPRQARVLDSIERDFGLERTHEQIRIEAQKDPFRAIESLTRSNLTFERAQVDRYFERLGFDPDKTRELTDRAMSDSRVLFASTAGASDKFTTREVVAEVRQLDSALRGIAGERDRPLELRVERVDLRAARDDKELRGLEQRQAALDALAEGRGLTIIEGFAGTGKSTMLRTAAAELRGNGFDVIGTAPSGKATKGLQHGAGIESSTLKALTNALGRGDRKLTHNSVVIVDEAGMAENKQLAKLTSALADAGGRLVLVGDDKQLGAVGRGGGFEHAREIFGVIGARLSEVFRQKEGWQADASKAFGEGRAREAIQSYIDHGRIEWAASRGTARDMLVSDYVRELDRGTSPDKMLALAHENRDVKAMNAEIRDAIKERGGLQGERMYKLEGADGKTQKIGIAVGDRVVFDKNSRDASGKEVKNGEFGTVSKVEARGFTVRMDDGSSRRVEDGSKQQMSHGYASSIHKSQGATVEKTFVLASKGMDSKLTYVALSRQKEDTKLYANTTEHKSTEHLKNSLSRDGGREQFKSVLAAGDGKERAQSAQMDRDHGPRGAAGEKAQMQERERQPVAAFVTAAAIDQKKIEPYEQPPQAGKDRDHAAGGAPAGEKAREGKAQEPAQQQGQGRQQEKSQGEQPVQREQAQGKAGRTADLDHAAGGVPAGEKAQGQQEKGQRQAGREQRGETQGQQGKNQGQGEKQKEKGRDHPAGPAPDAPEKGKSKDVGSSKSKSKGYGL